MMKNNPQVSDKVFKSKSVENIKNPIVIKLIPDSSVQSLEMEQSITKTEDQKSDVWGDNPLKEITGAGILIWYSCLNFNCRCV